MMLCYMVFVLFSFGDLQDLGCFFALVGASGVPILQLGRTCCALPITVGHGSSA